MHPPTQLPRHPEPPARPHPARDRRAAARTLGALALAGVVAFTVSPASAGASGAEAPPAVPASLRAAVSTDTNGARLRALLFRRGGAPVLVVERFDRRPLPGQGPGPARRVTFRGAQVGRGELVFAQGPAVLDQLSWGGRTLRFRARVSDRRYGCHVDTTGRDAYRAICSPRRVFVPPPPPAPPRPSRVPPRAPRPAPPGR